MRSARRTCLIVLLVLGVFLYARFIVGISAESTVQRPSHPAPLLPPTATSTPPPLVYPLSARIKVESFVDHTDPRLVPVPDKTVAVYTGHFADPEGTPTPCYIDSSIRIYSDNEESATDLRWNQDLPQDSCPGWVGGPGWLAYDGHGGYDLSCPQNTIVNAMAAGVVDYVEGSQKMVIFFGATEEDADYRVTYYHLLRNIAQDGEQVQPGKSVAYSGRCNGGDHLHFEVQHQVAPGVWKYVDPSGWEGAVADPLPFGTGNFWLGHDDDPDGIPVVDPIPMGYRDQNGNTWGPFALRDRDIRNEWFEPGMARWLGSPVDDVDNQFLCPKPSGGGQAAWGKSQDFERGYIYHCYGATTVVDYIRTFLPYVQASDVLTDWNSTVYIRSLSSAPAPVSITFYAPEGWVLESLYHPSLSARATWEIDVRDAVSEFIPRRQYDPVFVGHAVVASPEDVAVIVLTGKSGRVAAYTGILDGSGTGWGEPGSPVYVPAVMWNPWGGTWRTTLHVQNTHAAPATFTIKYCRSDVSGCQYESATTSLPPYGKGVYDPAAEMGPVFFGSARIESDRPLAVVVHQEEVTWGASQYNALTAGANVLYLPSLMQNWYFWTSAFAVQNLGVGEATVTIYYHDSEGDKDYTCTLPTPIPAKAVVPVHQELGPDCAIPVVNWHGSAILTSDQPIVAIVNQQRVEPHNHQSYSGSIGGNEILYGPFAAAAKDDYDSASDVMNVGGSTTSVTRHYYDQPGGEVLETEPWDIESLYAHGFYVPAEGVPPGFIGSIEVTRDDANPIIGIHDIVRYPTSGDYGAGYNLAQRSVSGLPGLNFPLTTGPAREPQRRVAAAYDPSAHRYMIAWEQDDATIGSDPDVYARLVSDEGSVLLEPIPVAVEPGRQTSPDVAYSPEQDRFLVVWSAITTIVSASDVFGRFYDVVGQPLSEPFTITRRAGSEDHPAVAYGGGAFLVSWEEDGDVHGRLVDPFGGVGSRLEIAVDPSVDQGDPAVAFGDGTFLAVWSEGTQIRARSVDLAGTMGLPEPVSGIVPDGVSRPELAYGGDGHFLVAWNQAGLYLTEAYARLVNGAGQAVSDPVQVGASPWSVPDPDVAFGGGQYLVVTHFAVGVNLSLTAVRVSAQGEIVGEPILVRGDPAQPYGPAAAAGPGGEFLSLWEEYQEGYNWNVMAQRVAANGDLMGPAVLVGSALLPPDQDMVAVAYGDLADGPGDVYLAVWEEVPPEVSPGPATDYDLYGRLVDPGGAFPGEIMPIITGTGNARMPALDYDPGSGEFLLAYSDDGAGGPPQVYLQRVGPDGPVDEPLLISASVALSQTHPDVAYGGVVSDVLLIVWQEGEGANSRIYGQLLDGQGVPRGGPFLLAEDDGGKAQRDAAVTADPGTGQFLVVWGGKDEGKERIYLQTVGYDGYVDPDPPVEVSVPAGGVKVSHPDIAGEEGVYVVVWARSQGNDRDVYSRRVTAAKGLPWPEETLLVDEGVAQYLPAVATTGFDEVLVVWQEGRNADVVGQLLRLSEAQLVGDRLDVSRAEGAQLRPAVAGDPDRGRYIAVWTDGRNVETSGLDIYGQLVQGFRWE